MKLLRSYVCTTLLGAAVLTAQSSTVHAGPFEQGEDGSGSSPPLSAPETKVRFHLILPLRNEPELDHLIAQQTDANSALYHKWLSTESFTNRYLPTPDQLAAAAHASRLSGLSVVGIDRRSVIVETDAARFQDVFRTQLRTVARRNGTIHLVAPGPLVVPRSLATVGALTPAFANVVTPRPAIHASTIPLTGENRFNQTGPYWFTDLKQAYDYPAYNAIRNGKPVDGTGASVAVIMSGDALDSDVRAMFAHEQWDKFTINPVPKVARLLVNGGPGSRITDSDTVEASLDVQMVLGGAPGVTLTLVEVPDLGDANIIDGLATIVDANSYDIVSMSIGGPQNLYLAGYNGGADYRYVLHLYDALFKQGCAQGITFIVGSGDSGGLASPSANYFDKDPHDRPVFVRGVNFLSDSPHVTSVGGGNLITSTSVMNGQATSTYVGENGFADPTLAVDLFGLGKTIKGGFWGAGGGLSFVFPRPAWQVGTLTGSSSVRTEPDVGMQVGGCPAGLAADPSCGSTSKRSAVYVYVGGMPYAVIGTSVAAPEFASAVAIFVGQGGRIGNLNPYIYASSRTQTSGGVAAFHRGQAAFDGYWSNTDLGPSYNYIYGNGSPDVRVLFGLTDVPPAGAPRTAQNP